MQVLQISTGSASSCPVSGRSMSPPDHYEKLFCQCNIGPHATQAQDQILNEKSLLELQTTGLGLEPIFYSRVGISPLSSLTIPSDDL